MTAVRIQPKRVRSCTSCWNFGFATIRSYSDALCASAACKDPGPWTTGPAGFVAWGYGIPRMGGPPVGPVPGGPGASHRLLSVLSLSSLVGRAFDGGARAIVPPPSAAVLAVLDQIIDDRGLR